MFECEEEKENVSQAKRIKAFVQSNVFVVHFGCCRHFVSSKPLGFSSTMRATVRSITSFTCYVMCPGDLTL